jgi:hypothetical protein
VVHNAVCMHGDDAPTVVYYAAHFALYLLSVLSTDSLGLAARVAVALLSVLSTDGLGLAARVAVALLFLCSTLTVMNSAVRVCTASSLVCYAYSELAVVNSPVHIFLLIFCVYCTQNWAVMNSAIDSALDLLCVCCTDCRIVSKLTVMNSASQICTAFAVYCCTH